MCVYTLWLSNGYAIKFHTIISRNASIFMTSISQYIGKSGHQPWRRTQFLTQPSSFRVCRGSLMITDKHTPDSTIVFSFRSPFAQNHYHAGGGWMSVIPCIHIIGILSPTYILIVGNRRIGRKQGTYHFSVSSSYFVVRLAKAESSPLADRENK